MSRACETVDLCTPAGDGRYKIYGGVSPRELLNYRTFLKNIGVKLRVQRTKKLALAFIKLKDHDILYRSTYIGKIEPLSEPARHIFELRQMRSYDNDQPDLILDGEIDVHKFFWPDIEEPVFVSLPKKGAEHAYLENPAYLREILGYFDEQSHCLVGFSKSLFA